MLLLYTVVISQFEKRGEAIATSVKKKILPSRTNGRQTLQQTDRALFTDTKATLKIKTLKHLYDNFKLIF